MPEIIRNYGHKCGLYTNDPETNWNNKNNFIQKNKIIIYSNLWLKLFLLFQFFPFPRLLNHDLELRSSSFMFGSARLCRFALQRTQASLVLRSLNHDLELRSSSFTFGSARLCRFALQRTQASLVLRSLNHDLLAIHNVDALSGLLQPLSV